MQKHVSTNQEKSHNNTLVCRRMGTVPKKSEIKISPITGLLLWIHNPQKHGGVGLLPQEN